MKRDLIKRDILERFDNFHRSYNNFLFHGEKCHAIVLVSNENPQFSQYTMIKALRIFCPNWRDGFGQPSSRSTEK